MITGTSEEWAVHLVEVCTCAHLRVEHINARGPCEHADGCCRFALLDLDCVVGGLSVTTQEPQQ